MAFDQSSFNQALQDYLNDCVSIRIVNYTGDTNPVGGSNQGVNIDVGEVHSFDLEISNNGPLGLLNVQARITARRGKVSGSFSGSVNVAGSQWMDPWSTTFNARAFNLNPNQVYMHRHEFSGGHLFGYKAEEPTGGTDNNRDVETILTATIFSWQPDLASLVFEVSKGPQDIWRTFIQRS